MQSNKESAIPDDAQFRLLFPCENLNNPSMREEHIRLQTFTNNPEFRRNTRLTASDRTLAQAGLYYLGDGDKCKCWFCGGGLMNFEEGDDPWFEHAKFYPDEALNEALVGKQRAADEADGLEEAVGGAENAIHMDGRMLRFIGPCSPINNSSHSTAHTSNPQRMMINGQSFDEIMTNDFDQSFLRGEMNHLRNNLPTVHIPRSGGPHTHEPFNNIKRPASKRPPLPETTVGERIGSVHGESFRNQDSHGGLFHEFMDSDSSDSESSTSNSSGYCSSEESSKTMSNSKYRRQELKNEEITNHMNCSATPTNSLPTAQEATTTTKASAEERLKELERERRCKICLTEEAVILFQPCGHICACVGCAERVKFCPVCRKAIDKSFRTFRA
uniref:baculoviral IAP repeat-containing protein 3-like n=1 Tax=Styela clava TaxID=7725 RepID=UPI00193A805C|nr:baculoviral IAP repeat-containing protein 3-like [Styela clava]